MPETSPVYRVAAHIHESFFGSSGLLTPDEIAASGVTRSVGSTSSRTSQRIQAEDRIDGRLRCQTLARDIGGVFHLSTTFNCGGKHIQHDIRPDTPADAMEVITDTIFMHRLVAIGLARGPLAAVELSRQERTY